MNKANVLIASAIMLMCLATVGVQGGWFSSYKHVNFDGLNKWLVKSLATDEDFDENVDFIKNNLNQLTDDKVKQAAEILVNIVEATECSQQLMQAFRDMADDKVVLDGEPRLAKIMGPALDRLDGLCGPIVDDLVAKSYAPLLATQEFAPFFEEVALSRPRCWKFPFGGGPSGLLGCQPDESDWAEHLYRLASHDSQAKNYYSAQQYKNRRAVKYGLEKYLSQPCKSLAESLGNTFEAVYGLVALRCSQAESKLKCARDSVQQRSNTTKPLLYAYQACKQLPKPDSIEFNKVYTFKFAPDRIKARAD